MEISLARRKGRRRPVSFKFKHRAAHLLLFAVLAAFSAALIARPERYVSACADGIALWAGSVLPSLFPFMVVCGILVNTGLAERMSRPFGRACRALKLPKAAATCFAIGIVCGYPAGCRTASSLCRAGAVTREECARLAALCSTSGPLFAIGTVGAVFFKSGALGAKLFAAHAFSVAAVAVVFSLFGKRPEEKAVPPLKRGDVLNESFYGAASAAMTAGAFIAFFYTVAEIAADYYILYPVERVLNLAFGEEAARAAAEGLIEMTRGCARLAECGGKFALPLAGFTVTFGGACVLLQQLCFVVPCGVKPLRFIAVKSIQAAVCFFILLAIR